MKRLFLFLFGVFILSTSVSAQVLTMVPGSTLVIKNGGVINMASGKEFKALVGVIVNIERGEIN